MHRFIIITKPNFLLLLLILSSSITFGQRTEQKKSYSGNVDKIENIRSSYTGCTLGPCYTWRSIALKGNDELLMQSGGHHPAGSKTRYFSIGTWMITGDTLKLNFDPESVGTDFIVTQYRIVNLYDWELLIPLDGSVKWDDLSEDLRSTFEQSTDYNELRSFENTETIISRSFASFVTTEYSNKKKLLVKNAKQN